MIDDNLRKTGKNNTEILIEDVVKLTLLHIIIKRTIDLKTLSEMDHIRKLCDDLRRRFIN